MVYCRPTATPNSTFWGEILRITDAKLVRRIRELLVTPYQVKRAWDYGAPDEHFICWTFFEHRPSNTGIAFCSEGFGPSYPWGLVHLSGPHLGMGKDSGWFVSLEEAMRTVSVLFNHLILR